MQAVQPCARWRPPRSAGRSDCTSGSRPRPVVVRQGAPFSHTRPRARTVLRAAPQKSEATDSTEQNEQQEYGFRWDPANLRWVRDKRTKDAIKDIAKITVTPKTGTAYLVWPAVHMSLTKRGLKSIPVQEAQRLQQEEGWVIADVRTAENFAAEHVDGAVSVPLFRAVEGRGFYDRLKTIVVRIGFAMTPTERDPDFRQKALAKLPTDTKIIVYCGLGGTLKVGVHDPKGYKRNQTVVDDPERQFGRESRSLKAAYELLEAGYENVVHMEGGLGQWRFSGLPTESS